MTLNPLIFSLYQIGAIKFGDFTLKSGQHSKIYLDLRLIISHPKLLRSVANALWQKVHQSEFDLICGVPYTALPIATCMSLINHIPMLIRRKEKKTYGTKQLIEGTYKPEQTCLIVEDVITTGSSLLETSTDLEEAGLKITDVAVLIDREQGGKENLVAKNYRVHSVFTLSEVLRNLAHSSVLNPDEHAIVNSLIQEFT